MIDTDKYEGYEYERMNIERWHHPDTPEEVMIANARLMHDAPLLFEEVKRLYKEVKRLREESKKKGNVLSTLDEMIRNEENHVEMMKALEQGLDLPETWKEMV